jgi:hypothetical protein
MAPLERMRMFLACCHYMNTSPHARATNRIMRRNMAQYLRARGLSLALASLYATLARSCTHGALKSTFKSTAAKQATSSRGVVFMCYLAAQQTVNSSVEQLQAILLLPAVLAQHNKLTARAAVAAAHADADNEIDDASLPLPAVAKRVNARLYRRLMRLTSTHLRFPRLAERMHEAFASRAVPSVDTPYLLFKAISPSGKIRPEWMLSALSGQRPDITPKTSKSRSGANAHPFSQALHRPHPRLPDPTNPVSYIGVSGPMVLTLVTVPASPAAYRHTHGNSLPKVCARGCISIAACVCPPVAVVEAPHITAQAVAASRASARATVDRMRRIVAQDAQQAGAVKEAVAAALRQYLARRGDLGRLSRAGAVKDDGDVNETMTEVVDRLVG